MKPIRDDHNSPAGQRDSRHAVFPHLTQETLDHPDSLLNRIAGDSEQADPFCCRTEWQFSYHESFNPDRELYFRNSNKSIVALAGYAYPKIGFILEPIESYWLFGCPLLGPDSVDLLESLLNEEVFCCSPPFVLISGLARGSLTWNKILNTFGKRYEIILLAHSVFRSASLDGNADGYLSRRSAKLRQNIRRASRKLADTGVVFERCVPKTVEQADGAYARMLAIEETSWKGIGKCGMTVQPSRDFYWLMLRRLGLSGMGRIIFAKHEGRDIGFIFGGITGRHYRGQQFSFADDWSSHSLGNLLQMEKIRWLCEEGIIRYDMGQDMKYKVSWAELELKTENLLLRPLNHV